MSIELNNKISDIKLVFSLLNYQDDARSHKHKILNNDVHESVPVVSFSQCGDEQARNMASSRISLYNENGSMQFPHIVSKFWLDYTVSKRRESRSEPQT